MPSWSIKTRAAVATPAMIREGVQTTEAVQARAVEYKSSAQPSSTSKPISLIGSCTLFHAIFTSTKMFSKFAAVATLSLSVLAAATPLNVARGGQGDCSTGPIQCCQSTETVSSR